MHRTATLMLWESGFSSGARSLLLNFLVPFSLRFGASSLFVGSVTSVPNLLGSIFQLLTPRLQGLSRRKALILFTTLQGAVIAALVVAPALPFALPYILFLAVLHAILSMMINPLWLSYLGDLIEERDRNRYFGRRESVVGVVAFGATLGGGILLDVTGGLFAPLFITAALLQIGAAVLYQRSDELQVRVQKPRRLGLREFIKRARRDDFGILVRYTTLMRLGAYLAAPYFLVYQLEVVGLDYVRFTILQAVTVLSSFLSMRLWTWVAEARGTRKVLLLSGIGMALSPLLWTLTSAYPALLLFDIIGGLSWAGFNFASTIYTLESTRPEDRPQGVAYFNLFNNGAIFIGSILGATLLTLFSATTNGYIALFAVSGICRLGVLLHEGVRIREARFVELRIRGRVPISLTILPRQGFVPGASPAPQEFRQRIEGALRHQRELDQLNDRRGRVSRMGERERKIYERKFIERGSRNK